MTSEQLTKGNDLTKIIATKKAHRETIALYRQHLNKNYMNRHGSDMGKTKLLINFGSSDINGASLLHPQYFAGITRELILDVYLAAVDQNIADLEAELAAL